MKHDKLKLICKCNIPYGIRDKSGYLFFFIHITEYPDQKKRYEQELIEQHELANYLLNALEERK